MQKIDENWWKLANIDREFLHTFWTTWGNSMKFSGKMCLKIILKVTKNQGFTFSLEYAFFEKPQGGQIVAVPFILLFSWYDFVTCMHFTSHKWIMLLSQGTSKRCSIKHLFSKHKDSFLVQVFACSHREKTDWWNQIFLWEKKFRHKNLNSITNIVYTSIH